MRRNIIRCQNDRFQWPENLNRTMSLYLWYTGRRFTLSIPRFFISGNLFYVIKFGHNKILTITTTKIRCYSLVRRAYPCVNSQLHGSNRNKKLFLLILSIFRTIPQSDLSCRSAVESQACATIVEPTSRTRCSRIRTAFRRKGTSCYLANKMKMSITYEVKYIEQRIEKNSQIVKN